MKENHTSKLKEYFMRSISTFLVIVAGVLIFFALYRIDSIFAIASKVWQVLLPIVYGLVFAYLMNPIVKTVEGWLTRFKWMEKYARIVGVLSALVVVFAVIVALCNMMLPELYKSIRDLITDIPSQLETAMNAVNHMIGDNTTMDALVKGVIEEGSNMLETWLKTDLLTKTNDVMVFLTDGVFNVVGVLIDLLVGFVVSVYVLFSKEKFAGQCKKIIYAVMKPKKANGLLRVAKKSHEIFCGFLIGKILDSLIIGILCFIGLTIIRMPYALLVSVIVGVTNVIPFFGPFIGAVPSVLLVALTDPIKGVYLAIFILALQQLDGNVIGPKILGESTGLSAFWVVFSISLGGGLFGFAGMIIGVPAFAVIYYLVETFIEKRLRERGLPTDTKSYDYDCFVDEEGQYQKVLHKAVENEPEQEDKTKSKEDPGREEVLHKTNEENAEEGEK